MTAAIKAHDIAKASGSSSSSSCAGGTQIQITITQTSVPATHLSAYTCGGLTSGNISGSLATFLAAVGMSANA